jgi:hypothetical protein
MIYLPNGVNIPFGVHVTTVAHAAVGHIAVGHIPRVRHPPKVKHAMVFTGVRQMHCVTWVKPPPGGGHPGGSVQTVGSVGCQHCWAGVGRHTQLDAVKPPACCGCGIAACGASAPSAQFCVCGGQMKQCVCTVGVGWMLHTTGCVGQNNWWVCGGHPGGNVPCGV